MATERRTTAVSHQETILVVEDEVRSQRLLRLNLEPLGYRVVTMDHLHDVGRVLDTYSPDLVVLDLKLAEGDGYHICAAIRAESPVPIIIVSAYGESSDKVHGFEVGADDYITKPFDPAELTARMDAVLRRAKGRPLHRKTSFKSGPLQIDFEQRLVLLEEKEVLLSRTEYRLLEHLALNAGRTLIADALLEHVWGPEYAGDYASLHLYVSRLRRKLGEAAHRSRFITTKPGIGYAMIPGDGHGAVRASR